MSFPATQPTVRTVPVTLTVNGERRALDVDPRETLLECVRERFALTGTKKGCDRGQCGACTVLADGRRINACLALAVSYDGAAIVTVEGLGAPGRLHPIQAAFIAHDAFQCGYCTPGQVVSAMGMLAEAAEGRASAATRDLGGVGPVRLDADEIRERMSGNLCRCGAYANIVSALVELGTTPPR